MTPKHNIFLDAGSRKCHPVGTIPLKFTQKHPKFTQNHPNLLQPTGICVPTAGLFLVIFGAFTRSGSCVSPLQKTFKNTQNSLKTIQNRLPPTGICVPTVALLKCYPSSTIPPKTTKKRVFSLDNVTLAVRFRFRKNVKKLSAKWVNLGPRSPAGFWSGERSYHPQTGPRSPAFTSVHQPIFGPLGGPKKLLFFANRQI